MADPTIYADATTLIGLARINRLDLLALLRTPICVTARVWAEVADDPVKPGVVALLQARESGLVAVVEEGDADAFPELDAGESTVLSAAAAVGAAVLINERRARAFIVRHPELQGAIAQVTGIVGLTLLAKNRGHIPAVKPLRDDLARKSFRISPGLYEAVLRLAGE